jgi:hypothetical protein
MSLAGRVAVSRRHRAWALAVAALLVLLSALVSAPARAGDPDRVWRTIESDHFVIHYYEPLGDVARRVAAVAERAHRTLAPAIGHEPEVKTLVVLVDDTDGANGFASVIPRNVITLFATAPIAGATLADHDDWLYGLVTHEYAHILHLDTIHGLPYLYNKLVGKTWSPNQILPRWIIEGLATYEESKRSAGGRTRNALFESYLRVPVLEGEELRLDEVTNGPLRFPRGNAAYLYGSHFLRWIFDRHGDDKLRAMSHANGENPLPFAVNRQIASVIGRPFTELYDDWRRHLRDKSSLQLEAVERRGPVIGRRLTFSDESSVAPAYAPGGTELWWLQSDGISRARIRAMPIGGNVGDARDVVHLDRLGTWDILADGSLVFEQSQVYRREYNFQDLHRWDRSTGRVTRLTRGKRARDPAVSPDERWVAFSMNGGSRSVLGLMPLRADAPIRTLWQGPGRHDQAFTPAWSPDGSRVAFTAWRSGGLRDIVVVEVATGAARDLTTDRALDGDPVWSPDGRWLYFTSDRTGIFNVFAHEIATGMLYQVTDVVGGAFEPAIATDGTRLAYQGLVTHGEDLFEIRLDPASWRPAEPYLDARPPPVIVPEAEATTTAPRPYRAIETLAPRQYTAQLGVDNFGRTLIVQTSGADLAGFHSYTLATTLSLDRGEVAVGGSYAYNRLRPGLRVSGSRSTYDRGGYRIDGRNLAFREEFLGATFSFTVPSERRPENSWSISFDYDVDWQRQLSTPLVAPDPGAPVPITPLTDVVFAGAALRVGYSDVGGYALTPGPQEGQDIGLSLRYDDPAIGAYARALTVNWSYRRYLDLPWGVTPTLSARLVGGIRVGDQPRPGFFALGGLPEQDIPRAILDSTRVGNTGFLRGYEPRTVAGRQFHLLNLEYRQTLWEIEHGIATLPIYFRRLHVAALGDAGTAYEERFAEDDLRLAVGGALRVDALFGYFMPGSFELGLARGLVNGGTTQTWFLLTGTL